jgi:hypothetical protein
LDFDRKNKESFQLWNAIRVIGYEFAGPSYLSSVLKNYSLKHVLLECVDVSDVRQTFYNVNNSTDLFTNVHTILSFKKIDL